ncbi:protein PERCC1-like [Physella acuta]|uniref:protein PERCC1-like n=1 Tax=Physella acuta TaxID=109671 RepID=UPI0027DB1F31|nr:protein PERCC1-like [Physella acuta]
MLAMHHHDPSGPEFRPGPYYQRDFGSHFLPDPRLCHPLQQPPDYQLAFPAYPHPLLQHEPVSGYPYHNRPAPSKQDSFPGPKQHATLLSSTQEQRQENREEEEYEDIEDDEKSYLDDEDLRKTYEQYRRHVQQQQPDVTSQLLDFACMVSSDIQKFFGRAKDQDDSCDVYEDKWATTQSGRELYYADLLRIAQGDTDPARKPSPSSSNSSPPGISRVPQYSGRRDLSIGIGPLKELFDYGLLKEKTHPVLRVGQKYNPPPGSGRDVVPMQQRKFPASFWREPSSSGFTCGDTNRLEATIPASQLPDFTDLMESWQGGGVGALNGSDRRLRL